MIYERPGASGESVPRPYDGSPAEFSWNPIPEKSTLVVHPRHMDSQVVWAAAGSEVEAIHDKHRRNHQLASDATPLSEADTKDIARLNRLRSDLTNKFQGTDEQNSEVPVRGKSLRLVLNGLARVMGKGDNIAPWASDLWHRIDVEIKRQESDLLNRYDEEIERHMNEGGSLKDPDIGEDPDLD